MRRTTLVAALSGLLMASSLAGPAQAARPPARTAISAHLLPATALLRSTAVVSGAVSPKGGSLTLQRLVGKTWQPLAHRKPSSTGAFSFVVRTPRAAASWHLRVSRAASKTTKAGVSPALTLHVVTTGFLVAASTAPVTAPAPLVVTGSVAPKATGAVQLQRLTGATWTTVATATLTRTSTFTITTALPAGSAQLRVVKPFTTKIAAGTSASLPATIQPAVAAPAITTVVLAPARVGQPYLIALTATGGTGPYTWSATGLPTGLALSAAGILAGTPVGKGSTSFATTVTDAGGRAMTATLTLAVAAPAGRLFSVGFGGGGQLGNGDTADVSTIVPVIGQSAVTSVTAFDSGAVAADADGTVWAWGDNTHGTLGTGNTASSLIPVHTLGLTDISAVAAMSTAVLALRADGTVWSWGDNTYGQLGDSTMTNRLTPVQVTGLTSVVAIAGGFYSGYALRSDGTVWAWGYNGVGTLGDGTTTDHSAPVQIPGLTGITAIAGHSYSGYALRSDGTVSSWGDNTTGQLGDGTTIQRTAPVQVTSLAGVTAIAAGQDNGYALSASGTVLAWGNSGNGGLGNGSNVSTATPVAVHNLTGVTAISSEGIGATARLTDGSVWVWGSNSYGQLGDGTITLRKQPVVMVGVTGSVALDTGTNISTSYVIAN